MKTKSFIIEEELETRVKVFMFYEDLDTFSKAMRRALQEMLDKWEKENKELLVKNEQTTTG